MYERPGVYACVFESECVRVSFFRAYVCVCERACVWVREGVCICMCVYGCVCVHVRTCMYAFVLPFVRVSVCS